MSFSDNPYSAPDNFDSNPITSEQKPPGDVSGKVKVPAIVLLVLAPISILAMGADFGFRVYNLTNGELPMFSDDAAAQQGAVVGAYIGAGVDLLSIVCQFVVIFGAIGMLKMKSYNLALVANVISVVPCLTACCVLGMPFGIWGLVVMNDPQVKAAFDR